MAKKPIRVFKNEQNNLNAKDRASGNVSRGSINSDRRSITQQVKDLPDSHVRRKQEDQADRYKTLLHCIYDAVLITDSNGAIIEVNARAEHILVYSAEQMKRMNVTDIIAGADSKLLQALHENVSESRYTLLEAVCVRSDETKFNSEIVVNQINVTSPQNLCFFIRDITERKESEAFLQEANERALEAERLQSRLDTLATLYHELNNPMQIMMCMAELDANPEYGRQLSRIMAVLDQLRSDNPLDQIVDEEGVSRYAIAEASSLEDCDPQRVLVVDDEELLRTMFQSALSKSLPYIQIDAASTGEEGVALFAQHHHSLVIMDISLPGISGEESYEQIVSFAEQNGWKQPRFIFCTGYVVTDSLREKIADGSIHTCLKKPLALNDLITAVQNRLAGAEK